MLNTAGSGTGEVSRDPDGQIFGQDSEVTLSADPAYDTYDPCVRLNGGRPVHVPMSADFRVDWPALEEAAGPRTRLLIVNSPHNPSGSAWDQDDVEALRRLLRRRDLFLLSDEVYEHIVFDGRRAATIAAVEPALANGEVHALVHGDGVDQFNDEHGVVAVFREVPVRLVGYLDLCEHTASLQDESTLGQGEPGLTGFDQSHAV